MYFSQYLTDIDITNIQSTNTDNGTADNNIKLDDTDILVLVLAKYMG